VIDSTHQKNDSYKMMIGSSKDFIPANMFVILFAGGERKIVTNKPNLTLGVFLQHALAQRYVFLYLF
jgi:hypothetical protein